MPIINKFIAFIICWLLFGQATLVFADNLTLRMTDRQEGTLKFYHDLLKLSLNAAGHELTIINIGHFPQKRSIAMFEAGKVDIISLLRTPERDRKYTDVDINLTSGLMGTRVLFVPPKTVSAYSGVKTLDDFRLLGKIGAFGANWFDEEVWQHNNLPYYIVDGEWRSIYQRLLSPQRGNIKPPFHYFSRSVTEIVLEAKYHPDLAIEPHLLFKYDRDFHFYLNENKAHLKPILENALADAVKSGLLDEIISKHFAPQLSSLLLENRVLILLKPPD